MACERPKTHAPLASPESVRFCPVKPATKPALEEEQKPICEPTSERPRNFIILKPRWVEDGHSPPQRECVAASAAASCMAAERAIYRDMPVTPPWLLKSSCCKDPDAVVELEELPVRIPASRTAPASQKSQFLPPTTSLQ